MKYSCEVIINKNRSDVVACFNNTENLYKWQKGLKSFEIIEGKANQDGLKSKLVYEMRDKEIEMIETIEKFNFPDEMIAIYESKNVWNRCVNTFVEKGDTTIYRMDTEFVCTGWMRLMTLFGKGMFKRQTLKDMEAFKNFAEML